MASCNLQLAPGASPLEIPCGLRTPVAVHRQQADFQNTDVATAQTVAVMVEHIKQAARDPIVTLSVLDAIGNPDVASDSRRAVGAWWHWIKRRVQFEPDETLIERYLQESDQLELLISPSVLLRMARPAGDCDDFTMLAGAGLVAMGLPFQIMTVAADGSEPSRWSHVYGRVEVAPGEWMAIDVSHGKEPGWEVPEHRQYRRAVWDLNAQLLEDKTAMYKNAGAGAGLGFVASPNVNASPSTLPSGGGSGWNTVLQDIAKIGAGIARDRLTPLRPGEYVQSGPNVRAYEVPGARPVDGNATGSVFSGASAMPSWIWLAVGGVVLLMVAKK